MKKWDHLTELEISVIVGSAKERTADFNTAMKSYAIGGWDGIGYRVSEGIGAIDIDHCIRDDGSLNDVAASILGIFSTAYFEKSPSGTGLRGFFKLSPDFAYDIFRTSGLMRDKWDRMTGDSTYGQITIRNAVSTNSEIYTPIADSSAEDDFEALDDDEEEAEVLTFEPDLSHITLTIEEMRPHTKPRYQRDEIGIGYAFADYFKRSKIMAATKRLVNYSNVGFYQV